VHQLQERSFVIHLLSLSEESIKCSVHVSVSMRMRVCMCTNMSAQVLSILHVRNTDITYIYTHAR
jgi:hypothetical protein